MQLCTEPEDNAYWLETVRQSLDRAGAHNVALVAAERRDFREILAAQEDSFDIAVVDSNEDTRGDRLDLVEAAAPLVRPGGYLVLDDSDRREYEPLCPCLDAWAALRFVGMKPRPLMACETTVFRSLSTV